MVRYYILDGHTPVPADTVEWARFFENADRKVARTDLTDGVYVSTVFFGLDHQYSPGGPPLIFATMIFGGEFNGWEVRYSTWDEAVAGHAAAVELAKSLLAAPDAVATPESPAP